MNRTIQGLLIVYLIFCSSLLTMAQDGDRVSFNEKWKFKLDSGGRWEQPSADDSGWRNVNLPHDWSIEGRFSKDHPATPGGGALPGGVGWYRKTFVMSAADKDRKVFIDFDGVYHRSEVWINGHYLGKRPNGYISFRYDLTPYLKYGADKNLVAVKVDNSRQPNSRWYSGSGIYRNVWLCKTGKVHIPQYGSVTTTSGVSAERALVNHKTSVTNHSNEAATATLETVILDAANREVAKAVSRRQIAPQQTVLFNQDMKVQKPRLWSVDNPVLYAVESRVLVGNKVMSVYRNPLGIRSFRFDPEKGFSLNGEPLKIRGVCNHHDLGALGTAFNRRAAQRQLELLKAMGCNGIRTAHNPPAPELLDLCDEMGFIVMNEAFDMWEKQKNPYDYHLDWKEWHRRDLEDFIKRDRNHPSVFIWSVGNEIQEQWGDEEKGDTTGRNIARELVAIVKSLDSTREITTANNEINTWNNLLRSNAFDMIGYNYNHLAWGSFQQRWPGKKFIVTESTSALATRGHYDRVPFDTLRRWPEAWDKPIKGGGNPDFSVSAYDHVSTPWGSTHEESLKVLENHPHIAGMYVWTGFDYLGEPTPYPWPARSSYFGILDLAGFPKDAYYLYQSVWTSTPVLHLYPHWNWAKGDTVDVVAYYNEADEVELYLNGRSVGIRSKKEGNLHVKWRLPYEPGTLRAVSRRNGKDVLQKEVKTAGLAARIVLSADRESLKADGHDLAFITASVRDAEGNLVPDADHALQFKVNGFAILRATDNGSPISHDSFNASLRKAFHGLALGIVQSKNTAGEISVEVSSPGLLPGRLVLHSE